MMGRVLVTGGCGFIGSNLVAALAHDRAVTVLDDLSVGSRDALYDFDGRTIAGSVCDPVTLREAMRDVDEVVHLAAVTNVAASVSSPLAGFETNVLGTLRVLEQCRLHGVRRVVFASTAGAMAGDIGEAVNEETPSAPASAYGASKLAGEAYCAAYAASYGIKTVVLRFSNVYGPGSGHKNTAIPAFCKAVLRNTAPVVYGTGRQFRDFIYVADLCEGIQQALRSTATGVFNIASGQSATIETVLAEIARCAGQRFMVNLDATRPGEVFGSQVDISKARRLLGFNPETSLSRGIQQTWDWFAQQQENGDPRKRLAAV